jgi:hypothetical protein
MIGDERDGIVSLSLSAGRSYVAMLHQGAKPVTLSVGILAHGVPRSKVFVRSERILDS